MLALFSAADATIIVAAIAAASGIASMPSRKAAREMKPNGGSTVRDAIDRIESTQATLLSRIDVDIVPRLDRGATILAEHADRLATLEARPPTTRSSSTDTVKEKK